MSALFRRRLLHLGGALFGLGVMGGLTGCSLHPLYAPDAFGNGPTGGSSVQSQLRQIAVPVLGGRSGQQFQEALESRLEAGEMPSLTRYNLSVSLNVSQVGLGVQSDSTTTYVRFIASAPWSLTSQDDPGHKILISGNAQAADSLNSFDNQPFGQELETNTVNQRLADALADQIVIRLAHYFTVTERKREQEKQPG
ncbi:hypothetical protein ACELLULO517_11365 [Acidisoma cellulosilytica]|uniref:Uncharacterized protein n=1 Tax=Acidisoma cellulosilyticum TaxID=2802395 RepID=A0A963Z178_9PROT|nr:LPS assembly lipoprotein LptE [Acidisoma cellulosilyticum]MCB8880834.1 hypothetical protein [Acidisoma cellulosilyticum]